MSHFVYAIKSEVDGRIYVGMTSNVERRVIQHNKGKTFSTRPYCPWRLFYSEELPNRVEARKRELYLKSGYGKEYLKGFLSRRE